jgi:hypothetical protein
LSKARHYNWFEFSVKCFVGHSLSFWPFSFGHKTHCIDSYSIYGFWLSSNFSFNILWLKFYIGNVSHLSKGTRQLSPRTTRTETNRPVSEDKSACKRGLVGPYVKTTWTINNYCCLTNFFNKIDGNHKDTVWHLSTVLGNVKKNPYRSVRRSH